MKQIWECYEHLEELVFVVDVDTYEPVYLNQKARETFDIHSLEELKGKKCYELLQNCATPCSICTTPNLIPGYFKRWRYYNAILNKYLLSFDTILEDGDKRYRMEVAIDIGYEESEFCAVMHFQNLEMLINDAVRIALQKPTPHETLQCMLERIGQILGGVRSYIFEASPGDHVSNTYEWVATGGLPQKHTLQNLPFETWASLYQSFQNRQSVVLSDISTLQDTDPPLYHRLAQQNVRSLVAVPLFTDGALSGFYGVDNPKKEFLQDAPGVLNIMGSFISAAIQRRNLVNQLHILSFYDQQTGMGNRHAFEWYLEKEIRQMDDVPIGVVFCDVTGLKQINDTRGHQAGDGVILAVCDAMRMVFTGCGLFRRGGDEFLAICPQATEAELKEQIHTLQASLKEDSIILAAGMSFGTLRREAQKEDIEQLISEAETQMYLDKSLYYQTSGIDRRIL